MKIRLEIELDLPEKYQEWPKEELAQFLFDEYVHYVPRQHLFEALQWASKAKLDTPDENLMERLIYERHQESGQWTQATQWSFETMKAPAPKKPSP